VNFAFAFSSHVVTRTENPVDRLLPCIVILLGPASILTATTRIFAVNTTTVDCDNVNTFSPASSHLRTPEPYSSINSTLYDTRDLSIAATKFE
jgi:hypothetical protein